MLGSSEAWRTLLQTLRTRIFLSLPALQLTPGEAAELLDVDRTTALNVLQALEDSEFLALTPDGPPAESCSTFPQRSRPPLLMTARTTTTNGITRGSTIA